MSRPAGLTLDRDAINTYFAALWPEPEAAPGQVVIAAFKGPRKTFRWCSIGEAAKAAYELGADRDVYVTIQAHDKSLSARAWLERHPGQDHPDEQSHRGCIDSAVAIPGVWNDIDCSEGVHRAKNLPSKGEALAFLESFPLKPTLVINSGGGLHAYWLFREPWIFTNEHDRQTASKLLKDFEGVIAAEFRNRGWHLDSVADLARILRVPGSVNHKGAPTPVTITSYDDSRRYNPSDLDEWVASFAPVTEPHLVSKAVGPQPEDELPDADLVRAGCAWVASLIDAPQNQTEPQWYGALGILGRCRNGKEAARAFSSGYPGYSECETDKKTAQAVEGAGPRTCESIRKELGGEPFCAACPSWGRITSPIQLGHPDPAAEAAKVLQAVLHDGSKGRLLEQATLDAVRTLQVIRPSLFAEYQEALDAALKDAGIKPGTYLNALKREGKVRKAAVAHVRRQRPSPYENTPEGLVWWKWTPHGEELVLLANFQALITEDIVEIGGPEERRVWVIEVVLGSATVQARVPSTKFAAMSWPMESVGPRAIVSPGQGTKDRARHAIQVLSDTIKRRKVYLATGWWRIEGEPHYLHGGGAIGPHGPRHDVEVDLSGDLSKFEFPEPSPATGLRAAFEATLDLVALAKEPLSWPLLAATYRAPLGQNDASLHIFGATGLGKSELAALYQQHYGAGMTRKSLPGSWSSTPNALEGLAHGAKDALLVIDDYVMAGGPVEASRMVKTADRLFRAQGNNAGRGRMSADARLRTTLYPRGMLVSTGEENVRGQSIRARVLTLEVRDGDIDFRKLTALQERARAGQFASLMAAFVEWLAPRYAALHEDLHVRVATVRNGISLQGHRRTPEIVANLMVAIDLFLEFLLATGTITKEEHDALRTSALKGITAAAQAHEARIGEVNPAHQFLDYLRSALASGRGHVAGTDGRAPAANAPALGWRTGEQGVGTFPVGDRVGWVKGGHLYLDARAAFAVAQRVARDGGEPLPESLDTVKRRLHDAGLLASIDARGGGRRLEVRRTFQRTRVPVLHLRLRSLLGSVAQVAQSEPEDIPPEEPPSPGGPDGPLAHRGGPTGGEPQPIEPKSVATQPVGNGPRGPLSQQEERHGGMPSSDGYRRGPVQALEVAQAWPTCGPRAGANGAAGPHRGAAEASSDHRSVSDGQARPAPIAVTPPVGSAAPRGHVAKAGAPPSRSETSPSTIEQQLRIPEADPGFVFDPDEEGD